MSALAGKSRIEPGQCRDPRVLIATGFGSGFAPWAPGTAGSLAAVLIWWFLLADLPVVVGAAFVLAVAGLGVWIVAGACRVAGVGDDPRIVLDEWLGIWIALLGCPKQLVPVMAAFLLFRLFDIAKPWPVSWADQEVGGAVGIVLDDLIAGVLAAVVLQLSFVWLRALAG